MSSATSLPARASAPLAPPRRLTPRQRRILDYIRAFRLEHGYPPTLRQIGAEMGIKSTNGVHDHLAALKRKGYIDLDQGQARGIVVLARPGVPASAEPASEPTLVSKLTLENVELRALLRRAQATLARVEAASFDIAGVLADVRKTLEST